MKPTGGPKPMDLSSATAAGSQQPKTLRQPAGAEPPAGDAVERVDIGHAVSKAAAPSESHSQCKKKDDKPNLVILKVTLKRESSLRALVDCGASNNFVRLQSLTRLEFEEVELPRSLLEVRLATGVVVRTEKRVLFRPMRHFVQTYFDDIFVRSRASEGKTAVEAHLGHLREVILCMRENHIYANINKCIFGAEAILFLGCFLGKDGVRADPEKVCAIAQWLVPVSQKVLRKWLGLANDLHEYSANYADMARPLTNLLKKDAVWS
ncbi:unnamed protein product [Phytophthora fragariaefolia]|uniref:Unnamed protein product n=1 Tax=Phytophthora fragariaefolia TaxID=1490495 RepID=A0A9W6XXY0_9STRA|nr:unnamed protein product [Phytophthora fragariaefolia]